MIVFFWVGKGPKKKKEEREDRAKAAFRKD
jgi:hypothetical protein